jgi:5,10-methenyltetrahydrofolate synthetase
MDTWNDIKRWRKEQRAGLLAWRRAAPQDERRRWSESEGFPLLQWMTVSFYWPIQGEFDARFAVRELRKHGARTALPVVVEKGKPLEFREWWPGVRATKGVFDLPVPEGTTVLRPQASLIPPLGFDRRGYRLGYGGGYFDRTLAALDPQPLKIGVGFELSRIATIHPQPHDVPMDFIVTEAGIHCVRNGVLGRLDDPAEAAELAGEIIYERDRASGRGAGNGADSGDGYASPACFAHEIGRK